VPQICDLGGYAVHGDPPTRDEAREKLIGLLNGRYSRDEIHNWARQWVVVMRDPLEDRELRRVIEGMAAVDTPGGPDRNFLFTEPDFHAWLDQLE
jgi:hypothetical protein